MELDLLILTMKIFVIIMKINFLVSVRFIHMELNKRHYRAGEIVVSEKGTTFAVTFP